MSLGVLTKKELSVLSDIISTVETELVSSKAIGITVPREKEAAIKSVKEKLQKASQDVHTGGRQLSESK